MKEKEIMFLSAGLSAGGAEKNTVTLANRLVKDIKTSVVCIYKGGVNAGLLSSEVELLRADKGRILAGLFFLARVLAKRKPAYLICNKDDVAILGMFAIILSRADTLLISRVANKPVYYYGDDFWKKKSFYYLITMTYKYAHRVICVSQSLRDEILEVYGLDRKKAQVIYNPPGVVKTRQDLGPNKSTIGAQSVVTIGRLVDQKNHFLFIDVLKSLEGFGNYEGVIIGEGPLKSKLVDYARSLGLCEKIQFIDYIEDPVSYLKNSDIYLMTSKYEGLPGSLMHALISGIKIVAIDCEHGVSEVLDNGKFGVLVEKDEMNSTVIAEEIKKLAAIDAMYTEDELARHLEKFDLDKIAGKWMSLLKV